MTPASKKINVYLEVGAQRIFAGALDWPGWCRSGRNEPSAIGMLAEYGPRYARAMESARLEFQPPADVSAFTVIERLKGNATTDFGSPGIPPKVDARPMNADLLQRSEAILKACWRAFDRAVRAAEGGELRKGPRGGGRELNEIARHLIEADAAYLAKVGRPFTPDAAAGAEAEMRRMRGAILDALGPRGGSRWTARYFVRRTAWHALDHAWEIEDRSAQD